VGRRNVHLGKDTEVEYIEVGEGRGGGYAELYNYLAANAAIESKE
jgi:hypothetical protein